MPISNLVECIQFAENEIQNNGLKAPMVGHVGDGNFHVTIIYDPKKEDEYKYIRSFSDKLIDKAPIEKFPASAIYHHNNWKCFVDKSSVNNLNIL